MKSLKVPFIIADIGSNWARYKKEELNFKYALLQIREAASLGVSAVKFQMFTHKDLYGYLDKNSELNKFALPQDWLKDLKEECSKNNIEFMCTAFSPATIKIVDQYVNIHKLASAELTYKDMLDTIKKTNKPFIISTAGAFSYEIPLPSKDLDMILMQCVGTYPAQAKEYNISVLSKWLLNGYKMVGISDHTLFESTALIALGAGALVFEKHFDLYDDVPFGEFQEKVLPDQKHSLKREDMKIYIDSIKDGFDIMGDGEKKPTVSELDMVNFHKRRYVEKFNGYYRLKKE